MKKKLTIDKETADDHPIIKSARSRLKISYSFKSSSHGLQVIALF